MEENQAIGELLALLGQTGRTTHRALQQVERCCPRGQFFMLERLHQAIRQQDAGTLIPVSALAAQTRMLPAAVSRSLRQLEEAGLVQRSPDPADHRRALVGLTPRGEATRREAEALLRDYLQRVVRRMGEAEFAALLEAWRCWDTAMRQELPDHAAP